MNMTANTPNLKMVIVLRKDLNMRKGKMAAQAGHAAQEALLDRSGDQPRLKTTPDILAWLADNYKKVVVSVDSEQALLALKAQAEALGLNHHLVQDHGHTEFHGVHTYTALALGPAETSLVDSLTGDLSLL